jgi:hypothetical protein
MGRRGCCGSKVEAGQGRAPGAWWNRLKPRKRRGDGDDETDEFKLYAAAVIVEEAVERKEALRVKLWLSELDVPEWQELARDRLGGGKC